MTTKPKARKFRIRRTPQSDAAEAMSEMAPMPTPLRPVRAAEPRQMLGADLPPIPGGRPSSQPQPQMSQTPEGNTADRSAADAVARSGNISSASEVRAETDMDAIRAEGLTGRQLRMARRVAQKHGLAVTSDFDAVRQLRVKGIDPFERSSIIELVAPSNPPGSNALTNTGAGVPATNGQQAIGRIQLPQTIPQESREVGQPIKAAPAERRAAEIAKIQRDLMKRRRRKVALLFTRLGVFVGLPALLCGIYFFAIATPMYATSTEFVIQKAEGGASAAGGLGGLFQGTSLANSQDSITVQSFLTSRDAMLRLDQEEGFKAAFSNPEIDPIQRLPADATNEQAYKVFSNHVKVSYDPSQGILKMEVIAPDPALSQAFSEALVTYAEEQVDQLTQRLRADQMKGALDSYTEAETRRTEALGELLRIQNEVAVISPEGEISNILGQVASLETRRQEKTLELANLQNVRRPNESRVNGVKSEIASIEGLIAELRGQMTTATSSGATLASKSTELRLAEENYQFQTVMVQQALTMMETARLEANRQVRYLSMGVKPVAPDSPTYPKAFENTIVAFLIFAGLYLMISLTSSILREQVSS